MLVWCPEISDAAAAILSDSGHVLIRTTFLTPSQRDGQYVVHWTRRVGEPYNPTDAVSIIACPATGTEHLDAARAAGKRVLSLRDCGDLSEIRATVEFTIGAILSLTRRIPCAVESVRNGEWDRMKWQGTDLYGKTAAIVGWGRIGSKVGEILRVSFGMSYSICEHMLSSVSPLGLFDVLPTADLVTIHCDLNPTSRGMFGPAEFAAMKPGAFFVNTARGAIVGEAALLAALESGHLGGAALDVLCDEPPKPDNPLIAYACENPSRLLISPHLAGCSRESLEKAETLLARKLCEVLADGG